jgi:hypothetical protein
MKSKLSISVIGLALVVALATAFASSPAASARSSVVSAQRTQVVNLQVPMKGRRAFRHAAGSSQYQSQPGQSEFEVEVEHVRTLAGKQLLVKVNGTTVGKMKVSRLGQADMTLNSELGQSVPTITCGSVVRVTTSTTGALVVSGSY